MADLNYVGDLIESSRETLRSPNLLFDKSIVKGGEVSRAVPVNADGRRAIEDLIGWHRGKYGKLNMKRPLFPSRNKSGPVAMNRQTAHEMLKQAFSVNFNGFFIFKVVSLLSKPQGGTMKEEKEHIEEMEEFFRTLEQKYEEYQRYYAALATLPKEPSLPSVNTEYGNSTVSSGGDENA